MEIFNVAHYVFMTNYIYSRNLLSFLIAYSYFYWNCSFYFLSWIHYPLYLSKIYPVFFTISNNWVWVWVFIGYSDLIFCFLLSFWILQLSALTLELTVEVRDVLRQFEGADDEYSANSPFVKITFASYLKDLFFFFSLLRLRFLLFLEPIR